jgi:hypothetical protein
MPAISLFLVELENGTVMTITGPLICVLGERYSWHVKSAVLDAIYNLLLNVDAVLKPFLSQLQPTFLKALNNPSRSVFFLFILSTIKYNKQVKSHLFIYYT